MSGEEKFLKFRKYLNIPPHKSKRLKGKNLVMNTRNNQHKQFRPDRIKSRLKMIRLLRGLVATKELIKIEI
jgi:hypothetical protein